MKIHKRRDATNIKEQIDTSLHKPIVFSSSSC